MSMSEREAVQAHIEPLTGFEVRTRQAIADEQGNHYCICLQWHDGPDPYIGLIIVPSNDVSLAEFYRLTVPIRAFANARTDQIISAGLYATGREPLSGVLLPRPMRKAVRAKRLLRPKFAA